LLAQLQTEYHKKLTTYDANHRTSSLPAGAISLRRDVRRSRRVGVRCSHNYTLKPPRSMRTWY
jgi:hypothetical protein